MNGHSTGRGLANSIRMSALVSSMMVMSSLFFVFSIAAGRSR